MKIKHVLIAAACWLAAMASISRADTYSCPPNNTFGSAVGTGYQLTSAQVTNDTANLYFNINLAAASQSWIRYAVAFVTGPGGCTSGNGSIHSGTTTSLAEGMNYWIACAGNAGSNVTSTLYIYNTNTLTWSSGSGPTVIARSTPTVTVMVPYASLGLAPGASVTFDVFVYDGSAGGTTCDLATSPITTTWYNQAYTGQNVLVYPKPVIVIPSIIKAGTGTELTTGASWNGGAAPSTSQLAIWGTGSLGAGLTLASATTWTGIRVTNALSDIDISGAGSLTLSNGFDLSSSPVNLAIATPVALAASQTWAVSSGKTLTVSGGVGDSGSDLSLTALGGGTLALAGANTYLGYTTLTNVTLNLVSPSALYTAAYNNSAVVTIQSGAILQFDNWGYGSTVSLGQLDTGVNRILVNGGTLQCVAPSGTSYPRSLTIGTAATRNGFMDALDIAGYNYISRLYGTNTYAPERKRFPHRLCLGTETTYARPYWLGVRDHDYVIGDFIWTGVDYLGEVQQWPERGSHAGFLDLAGGKKSEFFQRAAYWQDHPVLQLMVLDRDKAESDYQPASAFINWNWPANSQLAVRAVANCDEVEVFLNHHSLGRQVVSHDLYSSDWTVKFESGLLSAVGYRAGKPIVTNELFTTGEPARIKITPLASPIVSDISLYEIAVVDTTGLTVTGAQPEITIHTEGAGQLIGLDSGDLAYTGNFKTNRRIACQGRLLATVKRNVPGGEIRVVATSPGFPASEYLSRDK